MLKLKQKFILIIVFLIISFLIVVIIWSKSESPETAIIKNAYNECDEEILAQRQYLESEKLSEEFTFEKYPINSILTKEPADLDIESSKYAKKFKTMISMGLEKEGVNFAGHYTIVSVGMTGWGKNYWIIDRTNGKAYEFPYTGWGLDFRQNSNLIILDSKDLIRNAFEVYDNTCRSFGIGVQGIQLADLKPFYFLWENNELKLLGPHDYQPHVNKFWDYYFE